jgi:hypothetical protein
MGYLSKGYYIICLSPILALILYFFIFLPSVETSVSVRPSVQVFLIEVAVPIIGIQVSGLVLGLLGCMKNESMLMGIVHEIANIILILWGMLVTFYSWFAYGLAVSHPQIISEYHEIEFYATLALMGLLWIASGLFFIYIGWRSSKVVS